MATTTDLDTSPVVLDLVDEGPGPWSARLLSQYLAHFDFVYRAALELSLDEQTLQASDFTFIRANSLFSRPLVRPRALTIPSMRTGSLVAELAELTPVVIGGVVGGGLLAVAKALLAGPKDLAEWGVLPIHVKRRRTEERRKLAEEQIILLEAEQRLREIRSATPRLRVGVRTAAGSELVTPSTIALPPKRWSDQDPLAEGGQEGI